MEKKPRSLTVSESADYQPRIILKGAWLRDWGFTKGDQVTVTRTDTGDILIKFNDSHGPWAATKRKDQHECELPPADKFSSSRLRTMQMQVEKATKALRRKVRTRVVRSFRLGKLNLRH
jgi:hypothetical protein